MHSGGGFELRRRGSLNPGLFNSVHLLFNHFMKSLFQWMGVAALTAAVAFGAEKVGVGKSFKGPLGLQLYSLRADFGKNVDMALDEAKDFGFKYVELAGTYNMNPEQFRAALAKRGLKAVSAHFPYQKYKDDPESIAK